MIRVNSKDKHVIGYTIILQEFVETHGRPPTCNELIKLPELPSPSTLYYWFHSNSLSDIYEYTTKTTPPAQVIAEAIEKHSENRTLPFFYITLPELVEATKFSKGTIGRWIYKETFAGYKITKNSISGRKTTYKAEKVEEKQYGNI